MRTKFGVRRSRRVRSPTVREGNSKERLATDKRGFAQIRQQNQVFCLRRPCSYAAVFPRVALPNGRASDTIAAALIIWILIFAQPLAAVAQRRVATVTVDTSRPINRFTPSHALGAAIDGHEKGINDLQLKPA